MASNQIVPVQPDQALLAQGGLGLSDDALRPESLILVQPTSKDLPKGTPPGVFFDKSSGTQFETVRLVPLSMHSVRDKYPSKVYKPTEKATCRSRDGLVPITTSKFLVPEAPNCKACEFSQWDNSKTGKEAAPQCREGYLITFIEYTTKLPFYIKLSGMSVKIGKQLMAAINRQAVMANATAAPGSPKVSIYDFVVEMTAVNAGDSAAFMVNFPRVQRMKPEVAAEFGPLFLTFVAHKQRIQQEREEAENQAAVNAAADGIADGEYVDDAPQAAI